MTAFLAAIILVESGGDPLAVSKDGKHFGLMQIGRAYYTDAVKQLRSEGLQGKIPSLKVSARSRAWCECLFMAYMRKWEPAALVREDYELLARCHNGGCNWRKDWDATDGYWAKVKAAMEAK